MNTDILVTASVVGSIIMFSNESNWVVDAEK